jgi:hypothetical protein
VKVVLDEFELNQFCEQVSKGNVELQARKPQPGLKPIRLRVEDGPRLVVDKNMRFILFFTPRMWGEGTTVRSRLLSGAQLVLIVLRGS